MHGFTNPEKKYNLDFRINLYSTEKNNFVNIEVENNGNPFPKNYTIEKLIRRNSMAGNTGNTGQGGYDLNQIIKYLNEGKSNLSLIKEDPTSGKSITTYLFLIPLNI